MNGKELTDRDKFILQGRIYPAIQSCVNNRYKIILGIFVYYAFVLNNDKVHSAFETQPFFNLVSSLIFSAFVVHNFFNYWLNIKDRMDYEGTKECFICANLLELIFAILASILIWVSYLLFQHSLKI
jgi:succinate dehydrogenase hydrophobic anchor subunit